MRYLKEKFGENNSPQYHIVEIPESVLQEQRNSRRRTKFKTIVGSSDFHVAIFTPNADHFKASPRLCLCNQCMVNYGSCSLFQPYKLQAQVINVPVLRNDISPPMEILDQNEEVNEFVRVGTYVAIAARRSEGAVWVVDPFWIIKVTEVNRIDEKGQVHLAGHFLEKNDRRTTAKKMVFDLSKKLSFFFKESILYPYVNIEEGKSGLALEMTDYTDILYYVENNGYAHL